MANFENMVKSLPTAYRKDPWVLALLHAIEISDKRVRDNAEDMAAQMFLDSMSWQLATEEQETGLTPEAGSDRKAALSAKWRSVAGKCDIELIRKVCEAWDGTEAEVKYDGSGVISVIATRKGDMTDCTLPMLKALRKTIPAHLYFGLSMRRPEIPSGLHIGRRIASVTKMRLPALKQQYEFSGSIRFGMRMASCTTIRLPCLNRP